MRKIWKTKVRTLKEKAVELAQQLLDAGLCKEVFLFGSLTYRPDGKDIDLIIVTDQKVAEEFLTELEKYLEDGYEGSRTVRYNLASYVLNRMTSDLSFQDLVNDYVDDQTLVDIFVFPPHWRQSQLVNRVVNQWDPTFLETIMRQLRHYDPYKQHFIKFNPQD